jgi:hypothetical protein
MTGLHESEENVRNWHGPGVLGSQTAIIDMVRPTPDRPEPDKAGIAYFGDRRSSALIMLWAARCR